MSRKKKQRDPLAWWLPAKHPRGGPKKRIGMSWAGPVKITSAEGDVRYERALSYGQRRNLSLTGLKDARLPVPVELRKAVYKRDGHRCVICGTDKGPFQLDHIRPYSKGGRETMANMQTACVPCNMSKSNRWEREVKTPG